MKSKLIVKNFGPIESANLDLKSVNVFIGPQASGKSTLAKLYTICNSPKLYHNFNEGGKTFFSITKNKEDLELFKEPSFNKFKEALEDYSIIDCLSSKTEILFESTTHKVEIKKNTISFIDKIDVSKINESFEKKDFNNCKEEFRKLCKISDNFDFSYKFSIMWQRLSHAEKMSDNVSKLYNEFLSTFDYDLDLKEEEILRVIDAINSTKRDYFFKSPLYIPAERVIVNLLKQAALSFQNLEIPIPKHLLNFASIYSNASFEIKEFDIGFLKEGIIYKNINGEDRIYFSKRKSIKLTESASGFQSIIPIILPIEYVKNRDKGYVNYSFVIEEPETNLFPRAQYDLLKLLESGRGDDFGKIDKGTMHFYTTHSPFFLSSLNNLLFAYIKGNENEKKKFSNIDSIISSKSWINPKDFSAYQIINGKTKSIFNKNSGLIENNVIDQVSEDIMNDFRKIAVASVE
ncbi:AAA family ATPase [Chryseobacterium sp. SIMBA_038]|uniref:AAA family ATPase n=2 Tax=Pseudomonadati TaxID=3379134 RepID=UPI003979E8C6